MNCSIGGFIIRIVSEDEIKNKALREQLDKMFPAPKKNTCWATPFYYANGDVEVAYWIGFHGLIGEIYKYLKVTANDDYEYPVDYNDILYIEKLAEKYLDREYFEKYCEQNIWSYDECYDMMLYELQCLKRLSLFLFWTHTFHYEQGIGKDFECIFYQE